MPLIILLEILTFIAGTAIGIFVFAKNPRSELHIALSTIALGMAGWNLAIFLMLLGIGPADFIGHLSFAFAALLTSSFTWFILQFPEKTRHYNVLRALNASVGLTFIAMSLFPSFLQNVQIVDTYIIADFHPVFSGLWTLYYSGNFLFTFFIIIVRLFRNKNIDRARLGQIALGFVLFFIPQTTTNLILPLIFNDWRFNNLGPVFTILLIAFLANAVLRYRLLDIKWILGRSFLLSMVIGGVMGVISSLVLILSDIFDAKIGFIVGAFIVTIFIKPVWNFLEKILTRVARFGAYQPELATQELFNIVRTEGNLSKLVEKLLNRFVDYFAQEDAAFIVFEPKSTKIAEARCVGYKNICSQRSVSRIIKASRDMTLEILEKNELIWRKKFKGNEPLKKQETNILNILQSEDIETLIPLTVDSRLIGLIVLGKNNYSKTLRTKDLAFLELVRSGISPALENAAKLEQTQKLLERLSELDKAKSEFINIVSHRFRTPLSAIRWNLETVLDVHRKKIGKEVADALSDSQDRTLFLVETLDRLFDSLAIENGKLKLHNDYFNTKDAFTQAVGEYKKRCKDKGVDCRIKIKSFEAWGDAHRLSSVLRSLMSNALQYTPTGGKVMVEIDKVKNSLEFSVVDTGIGIPKTAKKKIFEKFYRAKNAILTYADGQGLGMFYVKEITSLHKGKVGVESELNKGTAITISIPIKPKKAVKKKLKK